MAFASPPSADGEFAQLVVFINESTEFLVTALAQLLDLTDLDPILQPTIRDARDAVQERSQEVVASIRSGNFDDALRVHGLGDGSPEWQFKLGVYRASRRRFDERSVRAASGQSGLRQRLRWMRHPFKAINVILKSVAAAIPGVGGALAELKDGTEAVIEDHTDET